MAGFQQDHGNWPQNPLVSLFEIMELTEHQIRLLLTNLPRDRNGLPIIPCETYITTDGVKCEPRFLIDFGVSVSQGDRYRQCTPQDVILKANAIVEAPNA